MVARRQAGTASAQGTDVTEDTLIAVQLRLNTAAMALQSAITEAAHPPKERDDALMACMLSSLTYTNNAIEMCKAQLHMITEHAA